ncbi:MAG: nucleotidyl transferase AbiEii/AbiGii toxin family protein [Candidatus Omnitrophica bacterium]|nr:nucleotidyl transferase AbiEii/AbiGii toxin family protein [Candidatus Omnitrophota bacterium]
MSIKIIQKRLESYRCRSAQEEDHALREITQEVALAALARSDFYQTASFQGGTCLRIFYGLNRFSEDLDFILKETNGAFSFEKYLKNLSIEFQAYGYQVEIVDRSKAETTVKKAFIKDDSLGKVLQLQHLKTDRSMSKIRIKIEVDTNPPQGSFFENKFLDFPFVCALTTQDIPSLFAGKIHALLCREYVKGRDWYDFLWYVSYRATINLKFLEAALEQIGPWAGQNVKIDDQWCCAQLSEKILSIDWQAARNDVARFIKPAELASLDLWNVDLFLDRVKKLGDV